ncbi:MAG TPA: hypothetical protein VFF17_05225, partial [Thermoanaerobaculia bacterium]|nr:hypothetical protein [Thermoanaerobaculia bacterium]
MKKRLFLAGILAFVVLLSGTPAVADQTLRFTVIGIDCKECAPPIVKALRDVPGVRNPVLDWKKGVATVDVAPGFDRTKIKKA